MQHIKQRLQQTFHKKALTSQALGSIVMNMLHDEFDDDFLFDGYVRHQTVYIKTTDQQCKIIFFQQKRQLLKRLNDRLSDL